MISVHILIYNDEVNLAGDLQSVSFSDYVVAARAVVAKDVEPWTVVVGHPAKFVRKRSLNESKA